MNPSVETLLKCHSYRCWIFLFKESLLLQNRPRQWRVDVSGSKLVKPMRVRECYRHGGVSGQLPLEGHGGLQEVGRPQRRADFFDDLLPREAAQQGQGRNLRIEVRIRDHVLLLHDAVLAVGGKRIREREAIVDDTKPGANNILWSRFSGQPSRRPG